MADTSFLVAVPGIATGIAAIILGTNSRKEIKQKADKDYVAITKEATDLLLDRMNEIKEDNVKLKQDNIEIKQDNTEIKKTEAKCNRNIYLLRQALVQAGVDVPPLE